MIKRITTLTRFLFGREIRALSGGLIILSAAVVWWLFFNPQAGRTPEISVLTLVIGMYGFVASFVLALMLSAKVYRAESGPMLTRLPSRVEFLAAILLTTLLFILLIQTILAIVVLVQPNGATFVLEKAIEIPPIWIAVNVFATVLAFHATDFVYAGWSRVWLFGVIALLLFSQSADTRTFRWFSERLRSLSQFGEQRGWQWLWENAQIASVWMLDKGQAFVDAIGVVFWPFRAISEGVRTGWFSDINALAPAVLLLYATLLFLLAADFLSNKDLHLFD